MFEATPPWWLQLCVSFLVVTTLQANVSLEGNKTAVNGKSATLSCRYDQPQTVRQVLWQKTLEQGDTSNVAFITKQAGPVVHQPFLGHVTLSPTLEETRLSISPVRMEDEGCYTCKFHVFPEGTKSAMACLAVYVLPKPHVSYKVVSPGVIEANCTTVSRPAAEVAWNVEGHNRTLGPAVSSISEQGDGTSLVVSTILFQEHLFGELSVKCLVHHRGLESAISVSVNTRVGESLTVLIAVTCVAAVLVLCLCVCLWKCFLCRDY